MALKTVQLQIYVYSGTSGNYASTDLRYTLSFNTWVEGEVGGGHSKLKL